MIKTRGQLRLRGPARRNGSTTYSSQVLYRIQLWQELEARSYNMTACILRGRDASTRSSKSNSHFAIAKWPIVQAITIADCCITQACPSYLNAQTTGPKFDKQEKKLLQQPYLAHN
jgi:hypothetical protein